MLIVALYTNGFLNYNFYLKKHSRVLVMIEINLNKNNSEEEILVLEVQTHSTGVIYFWLIQ